MKNSELLEKVEQLPATLKKEVEDFLSITADHLNTLLTLPLHHKDPFDRLIIAQAVSENLTLVSADQHFRSYSANLIE